MNHIGGFFELEIPAKNNCYHKNALALNNGRSCLSLIIKQIKPRKIYCPYYSCRVVHEIIRMHKIRYQYYHIDTRLNAILPNHLSVGEYIVYINYFGLKSVEIRRLIRKFGYKIIIDNAQAFFEKNYGRLWAFNSARKFFGVPDGAFIYSPYKISIKLKRNIQIKYEHLVNRLLGRQQLAYKQFLRSEKNITPRIAYISQLSERILSNVDFKLVAKRRRENFIFLHKKLKAFNEFRFEFSSGDIPLCYPFLPKKLIDKKIFYKQRIFIPIYWDLSGTNKLEGFEFEEDFSRKLLPLPIDQRYNFHDLNRVVDFALEVLKK